ncbi:MAG: hypothetical protein N2255_04190, partial [Kiritimatiellae bacterium]|nr:hypothetical protein [Kiritimatiellia bacterium]
DVYKRQLYVFGPTVSRAEVAATSGPDPAFVEVVQRRYKNYLGVFERVYGDPDYGRLAFRRVRIQTPLGKSRDRRKA